MPGPDFIGTLPGWITSAGVAAILAIIVRWQLGLKKIAVAAQQVEVNAQQVEMADEADRRDHIAEEMAALRENIASLRTELHACEAECAAKIKAISDELWGEKRQRVAEQIAFINMILKTVDAPELKTLLTSLETVQRHISAKVPISPGGGADGRT